MKKMKYQFIDEEAIKYKSESRITIVKCDLCPKQIIKEEQSINTQTCVLKVCDECSIEYTNQFQRVLAEVKLKFHKDKQKLTLESKEKRVPKQIKFGQCSICYDAKILECISSCKQGACQSCLYEYFSNSISSNREFTCFCCKNIIEDLVIVSYVEGMIFNSACLKPKLLCPKSTCQQTLTFDRAGNILNSYLSFQNAKNQMKCSKCNSNFCQTCFHSHRGACNFDQILRENMKDLNIDHCPKCQVLVQMDPNCPVRIPKFWDNTYIKFVCILSLIINDQTCPLCDNYFCWECKQPVMIFNNQDSSKAMCYKCKYKYFSCNGYVRRFFSQEGFIVMWYMIIYALLIVFSLGLLVLSVMIMAAAFTIVQGYQISEFLMKHTKLLLEPCPRQMIILFMPIIVVMFIACWIIGYFCSYLPLMIHNFISLIG